jgi:hypothetical protein
MPGLRQGAAHDRAWRTTTLNMTICTYCVPLLSWNTNQAFDKDKNSMWVFRKDDVEHNIKNEA